MPWPFMGPLTRSRAPLPDFRPPEYLLGSMHPLLRARFDELEQQRHALLADFRALSPAQLAFQPAPDAWSLAYLLQHLVLVEEGTLQFLTRKAPRPDTRTAAQRLRFRAFRLLMPYALRVKAPVAAVLPTVDASLDELSARWDAARDVLERYLEGLTDEHLALLVFKHAFGGPLTILETLDVFRLHIVHHGHQIRRIRTAAGFPVSRAAAMPAGAGA